MILKGTVSHDGAYRICYLNGKDIVFSGIKSDFFTVKYDYNHLPDNDHTTPVKSKGSYIDMKIVDLALVTGGIVKNDIYHGEKGVLSSFANRIEVILKSAINENPRITRPISGIDYQRIDPSTKSQAIQCADFIKNSFANGNEVVLEVNSYTSQLIFQPDASEAFEETVKELGWLLGFKAQRPEKDFGQGPDVLWEVGDKTYFVIECKNGVTSANPINKHDCNQMNGSIVWFSGKYGDDFKGIPIMIHPKTEFEYAASLDASVGIINGKQLEGLRNEIRKCASSICAGTWGDPATISGILKDNGLTKDGIQKLLLKPNRVE